MADTPEDRYEQFKGRYVDVRVRMLQDQLSRPREMMYAGKYVFIEQRDEALRGNVTFHGFLGAPENVSLENETFILDNRSPGTEKFHFDGERGMEVEELWEFRRMRSEEGMPF